MKKLFLCLAIVFFASCSDNDQVKDNLDLSNLDLSEVNFGFDKDIVVDLNVNDSDAIAKLSNQLIDEADQLIDNNPKKVVVFNLTLDNTTKKVTISDVTTHDFTKVKRGDPIEDLIGSCPDGWKHEGNCSSASCVKQKVAAVLLKVKGSGDCQRVEVSRGMFSATVCSQSCN